MLALVAIIMISNVSHAEPPPIWRAPLASVVEERKENNQFVDGAFGVINRHSVETAVFGGAQHLNVNTIFEIGSITKSFTGIIFAEMVQANLISPDDEVQKYLPELKDTAVGRIHLQDLAQHTSGLARIPDNIPFNENPYADYSMADLLKYLKTAKLKPVTKPDSASYSNTGFALLGQILARVNGSDYETLLKKIYFCAAKNE